jgi:hypothetical protein
VLVLAISDPAAGSVALERARHANPRIEIVLRTHAEQTAARLRDEERVWPIVGERELGVQMARVTLRRFGISGPEVEAIAQGLRVGPPPSDPGGGDRRSAPLSLAAIRAAFHRRVRLGRARTGDVPAVDPIRPEAGVVPADPAERVVPRSL